MHWEDGLILEYAHGTSVFAYVEAEAEPIELGSGWVTEDGQYWPSGQQPTKIIAVLTTGLCSSYDEEPFDWGFFKSLGKEKVICGNTVTFHPERGPV